MGIFDRISRIVRAEITAARRKAGGAWEDRSTPGSSGAPNRAGRPSETTESARGRDPQAGAGPGPKPGRPPTDPIARSYARLEVAAGSDLSAVKKGYRAVMRRYHPDRHGTDPEKARIANEVAAALTDAYDTLTAHLQG